MLELKGTSYTTPQTNCDLIRVWSAASLVSCKPGKLQAWYFREAVLEFLLSKGGAFVDDSAQVAPSQLCMHLAVASYLITLASDGT